MTLDSNDVNGMGLWKAIADGYFDFIDGISFKVGKGTNVRFWFDAWCGDPLFLDFLEIYSLQL